MSEFYMKFTKHAIIIRGTPNEEGEDIDWNNVGIERKKWYKITIEEVI